MRVAALLELLIDMLNMYTRPILAVPFNLLKNHCRKSLARLVLQQYHL